MAGHNKWTQIKRLKAVTDAKKSKVYSKMARLIAVEAKLAQGKESPSLKNAIEKAKKANVPNDVIERALKKATDGGEQMDAITYEAYGPGGVGIIIETLTDSKNRTAQDVKHILSENGTSFAGIGSVVWAFKKEITPEGLVWTPTTTVPVGDEDMPALEKLVEDLENNDDVQDVYTNAE